MFVWPSTKLDIFGRECSENRQDVVMYCENIIEKKGNYVVAWRIHGRLENISSRVEKYFTRSLHCTREINLVSPRGQ